MNKKIKIFLKKASLIDIFFILFFIIFLYIPISHINKSQFSIFEKRKLASKPQVIINNKINYNFGKDFDKWFNDRFFLRFQLLQLNTLIKFLLNKCLIFEQTVYIKKHNFFYASGDFGLYPDAKYQEIEKELYVNNLNKLNEYYIKNNIKLYLLIAPRRIDFFNYKIPYNTRIINEYGNKIITLLKEKTNVNIIYPIQEMQKENEYNLMYYKTDHHWTKKGAYIGYRELMKEIKKDFPNVTILQEDNLIKYYDNNVSESLNQTQHLGQSYINLALPLFLNKKILDTQYLYYKNPQNNFLKMYNYKYTTIYNDKIDNEFYYEKGLNKKVILIGNSFVGNLLEFLPYSFKYTLHLDDNDRLMNFSIYKKAIEEFKPDIIIINTNTNCLHNLLRIYN